jgi:ABC-type transport system involved in multi-copper enzyme maturation permease subunit
MSLVNAERRRLFKRRATKIVLGIVLLIMACVVVGIGVNSHQDNAAARAIAHQRAVAVYQQQLALQQRWVQECETAKAAGANDPKFGGEDCSQFVAPTQQDFPDEEFLPYMFNFRQDFPHLMSLFAALLVLFGFVVGATFVGAEWNSGGMMNLLVWKPRRLSVLVTKLGTLLGGVLAVGVLLELAWTGAFYLIGKYSGTVAKLTPGVWRSIGLDGVRALGIGLIFAAVGFALASLGRHTAMALGVAIGVLIGFEVGLRIVLELMGNHFYAQWMPSTYAAAWTEKSITLFNNAACDYSQGQCDPPKIVVTWQQSGLLFGAIALVTLAAAFWSMRRRDVT